MKPYRLSRRGKSMWCVDYVDPGSGKRQRRQLFDQPGDPPPSKQTRKLAMERATKIARDLDDEATRLGQITENVTFAQFIHMAKTEDEGVPKIGEELAPSSIRRRNTVLDKFKEHVVKARIRRGGRYEAFGEHGQTHELNTRIVTRYFQARKKQGIAPRTLDREAQVLKRAFRFALAEGLVPRDWAIPVNRSSYRPRLDVAREERKPKAFTAGEVDRVLQAARDGWHKTRVIERGDQNYSIRMPHPEPPPWLAPFVEFLLETGMRPGEARGLQWNAVDFENQMITVRGKTSKTAGREIPMTLRCEGTLKNLDRRGTTVFTALSGRPLDRNNAAHTFRRLLESDEVGLTGKGKSLYSCRHTFAYRCRDQGVPVEELALILGHVDKSGRPNIETTAIYLDPNSRRYASEFRKRMAGSN